MILILAKLTELDPQARARRDECLERYRQADATCARLAAAGSSVFDSTEHRQVDEQRKLASVDYFGVLPRVPLGRCPYCDEPTLRTFDPWDLRGLWWQEKRPRRGEEPRACSHFRVLTGALSPNGHPPQGGDAESYPGPDVPYVVPRLLGLPGMLAVVGALDMANGYRAYPIAYYSDHVPPPGSLTQTWTRRSFSFVDSDGDPAFSYDTSPWDFDLPPWVNRGKLLWTRAGDPGGEILRGTGQPCPYVNLAGSRLPQEVQGSELRTLSLPDGRPIDPFSE